MSDSRETAEKETAGNRHLRRDGYIVPTKSIKGVSLDLSELGYREIWTVADKALDLHEYQYDGLDPGFSPCKRREEAMRDIIIVMGIISERLYEWLVSIGMRR